MNLYARLFSINGDELTYRIGYSCNNITGIVVYNFKTRTYKVVSEPIDADMPLYRNALTSLFAKYQSSFVKGIFPEKISREIG